MNRVCSLLAGRLNSISSRRVVRMRWSWPLTRPSLSSVYASSVAALEHLHQRADGGERVADLVGDAGGEQAEGGHLLLVQHVGLRLLQFAGALGDAGFELGLVLLQGGVELAQVVADALEQQRHGVAGPRHPAEHDQRQDERQQRPVRPAGRAR